MFVAVGLVLVANPVYLESILCTDCGFGFTPEYFALATAAGVACTLSGLGHWLPLEYRDRAYLVFGIFVAVLASVVLVEASLDPTATRLLGYHDRETVVAALVAGAFLAGVGIARRNRGLVGAAAVVPVAVAVFVGPFDALFFLGIAILSPHLFGVPLLAGVGFVSTTAAVTVAGFSYGTAGATPEHGRSTGGQPDPRGGT
ncbi:hypothetical protein BRD00_11290 [Halobacteriales archaeon QS_8_69_26]|nr:MAG: hypothetical protein BRD00_11290 [Halobacteriales archaeon QS_8_69_26]